MKKAFLFLFLFFLAASISNAQYGNDYNNRIGVGLEVALPQGDWSDAYNTGFGGTARFEMPFAANIVGMVTAGYLSFGGDDIEEDGYSASYSASVIPIMAGVKYYLSPGFYGMTEVGFNIFSFDSEVSSSGFGDFNFDGGASTSETKIGLGIGAGYEMPLSMSTLLDLSVAYKLVADANYLNFRAGVKFEI